jgi:hypothetical protein
MHPLENRPIAGWVGPFGRIEIKHTELGKLHFCAHTLGKNEYIDYSQCIQAALSEAMEKIYEHTGEACRIIIVDPCSPKPI